LIFNTYKLLQLKVVFIPCLKAWAFNSNFRNNIDDNTDNDNEILCYCGLCKFVRYISYVISFIVYCFVRYVLIEIYCGYHEFVRYIFDVITFNNYVYFIVISALIEIYFGYSFTNFAYFTIGYIHFIYILRLLKYKILSNIIFMILLPIYYKLSLSYTSISLETTFDLHNQCINFIIIMQAICFIVKFIMFINKLLTIPKNEFLCTTMYNAIL
jgi:hypothetical protein